VRWRSQVTKSCAIPDRGGGASRRGGGGRGGACALTSGAANNRNDRENAPALNTLDLTVIPSSAARDRWQLGTIGLAEIRAVLGRRGSRNSCPSANKSPAGRGSIHEWFRKAPLSPLWPTRGSLVLTVFPGTSFGHSYSPLLPGSGPPLPIYPGATL
jgi:hypothetical protein